MPYITQVIPAIALIGAYGVLFLIGVCVGRIGRKL